MQTRDVTVNAVVKRIEVGRVPTVADLRARRLELTRAALREAILEDDLDQYRVIVEALAGEFDAMVIALAAVKLAHKAEAGDGESEEEIPPPRPPRDRFPEGPPRDGRRFEGRGPGTAGLDSAARSAEREGEAPRLIDGSSRARAASRCDMPPRRWAGGRGRRRGRRDRRWPIDHARE